MWFQLGMAQVASPVSNVLRVPDIHLTGVGLHPHGGQADAGHFGGHADGGIIRFVGQREALSEAQFVHSGWGLIRVQRHREAQRGGRRRRQRSSPATAVRGAGYDSRIRKHWLGPRPPARRGRGSTSPESNGVRGSCRRCCRGQAWCLENEIGYSESSDASRSLSRSHSGSAS